jgi:hypothetical protein
LALHEKALNGKRDFSAIEKKVVIKQDLTAAVSKCLGEQIPSN